MMKDYSHQISVQDQLDVGEMTADKIPEGRKTNLN